MTARPPFDEHDALDPEERELAARLSAFDGGGPSAALDARILAAARASASGQAPADRLRAAGRRTRRWPTAIGAVATLVVAVGLAWQLKPLVDVPPPLRRDVAGGASDDVEVLAQAAPVPAAAAEAATGATADAASPPAAAVSAAPTRVPSGAGRRTSTASAKARPQERPESAVAPVASDFVDEAVGDDRDADAGAVASAAAPPAPPAAPAAVEARSQRSDPRAAAGTGEVDRLDRSTASGSRISPPVSVDAALAPPDWLARIRERRDSGDIEGARESLRRFVRAHPRHGLPDDLRELRASPR